MNRNEELKYKGMQSLIRNCKEIIEGSADEELLFNNANKPIKSQYWLPWSE